MHGRSKFSTKKLPSLARATQNDFIFFAVVGKWLGGSANAELSECSSEVDGKLVALTQPRRRALDADDEFALVVYMHRFGRVDTQRGVEDVVVLCATLACRLGATHLAIR